MRSNIKYLMLALDVRLITDSLIEFVEKGKDLAPEDEHLQAFLRAIEECGATSVAMLREMGKFGVYENLKTINDVWGRDEKKALLGLFRTVLKTDKVRTGDAPTANTREESALKAIEMLDALERAALHLYSHRAA